MSRFKGNRNLLIGIVFMGVLVALACVESALDSEQGDASGLQAPMFEVDPLWPKPLPNHWIIGSAIGVTVDSRDHVFIIHRQGSLNTRTEAGASQNRLLCSCAKCA